MSHGLECRRIIRELVVSIAFVLFMTPAIAGRAVSVFGLPLGGQLAGPLLVCDKVRAKVVQMCWLEPPFVHEGARLGAVVMPESPALTGWLAHADFELQLAPSGELVEIGVMTALASYSQWTPQSIMASISEQFGRPTQTPYPDAQVFSAAWDMHDMHISLLCAKYEFCKVTYSVPKAYNGKRNAAFTRMPEHAQVASP